MDKEYWDNFYKKFSVTEPSPFAEWLMSFMEDKIEKGDTIFELGCGNGRDAIYFCNMGFSILAVDPHSNGHTTIWLKTDIFA